MARIGLLGGSFNPAHRGHRHISLWAIDALGLDEVWWLVSPGNPLKEGAEDMAPFEIRLASAERIARRARIRAAGHRAATGQAGEDGARDQAVLQHVSTGRRLSHDANPLGVM